jgi:hypothetical protein
LAGSAFKNADVIEAMEHFTPILVDGDTEKGVVGDYGVSGYPHIIFANVKGETVSRVRGAVPTAKFLSEVESAKKKAKRGKGSKQYRALVKADAALTKALGRGKVKSTLAAAKNVTKVELDHPMSDRAQQVIDDLMKEGEQGLAAARKEIEAGDLVAAQKRLRKLGLDYKGTDLGKSASGLLAEVKAKLAEK